MNAIDLLLEASGRVPGGVEAALDGLGADQLAQRLGPGANTVADRVIHIGQAQYVRGVILRTA